MSDKTTEQAAPATAPVASPAPKAKGGLRSPVAWRILKPRGSAGGVRVITDDDQLARVLKGDQLPKADLKIRWYEPGEVAMDIPASAVGWLTEGDDPLICEANSAADPYSDAAVAKKSAEVKAVLDAAAEAQRAYNAAMAPRIAAAKRAAEAGAKVPPDAAVKSEEAE